jgi:anti-sigma-K factor RskA
MERHVNPEDPDLCALGALDGEEKQAFEAHVRACPACAAELEAARRRVALLGLAAPPAAPSSAVRKQLLDRVRTQSAASRPQLVPRRRRFSFLIPTLATATLFFAVLSGWLWRRDLRNLHRIALLERRLADTEAQSQQIARTAMETDKLLGMPGTVRVALKPMPGMPPGRVGVLYNAKMGMVACAGWLPAAPPKKSYQLWLVPMKGKPMSLRVFSGEWNEPMSMHIAPGMEAKEFAVTEEPQGGMPWPSGPMVLTGAGE